MRETINLLRKIDSCSLANAIELLGVRLRNEGYTDGTIRCQTPGLPSILGFAGTLRIRTSAPPADRKTYLERTDWWDRLLSLPEPRILVVEEISPVPDSGAFVGEVHAHILQALGCEGIITNGSASDIPKLAAIGFNTFSSSLAVSHAYMHVVDFEVPVTVGGLVVNPGDLLHGDLHGVINVPKNVASLLPDIASQICEREHQIINYCLSPKFSVEGLRSRLAE